MRRARCAVVVAVVWSLGLPLLAGEVGLAERLKESVGELGEAYGQLAAQLERAGIPVPPAREAWERVRFARRLLRRIRRDHADAAELPGAQQQAELWPKMLDVAARAIRSQMANRHIEAMRLEAELDILRLSLGQQREKRELQEEFRAILEFAAEHRGDPRVAAVLADLKARFAALGKAQEMRFQAERAEEAGAAGRRARVRGDRGRDRAPDRSRRAAHRPDRGGGRGRRRRRRRTAWEGRDVARASAQGLLSVPGEPRPDILAAGHPAVNGEGGGEHHPKSMVVPVAGSSSPRSRGKEPPSGGLATRGLSATGTGLIAWRPGGMVIPPSGEVMARKPLGEQGALFVDFP